MIGALEEQAKTAAIDTTTFVNKMKELYKEFPTNENVFGKLTTLKGAPKKVGGDFYCRKNTTK